jgi:small-conductance mechanosensitive channel
MRFIRLLTLAIMFFLVFFSCDHQALSSMIYGAKIDQEPKQSSSVSVDEIIESLENDDKRGKLLLQLKSLRDQAINDKESQEAFSIREEIIGSAVDKLKDKMQKRLSGFASAFSWLNSNLNMALMSRIALYILIFASSVLCAEFLSAMFRRLILKKQQQFDKSHADGFLGLRQLLIFKLVFSALNYSIYVCAGLSIIITFSTNSPGVKDQMIYWFAVLVIIKIFIDILDGLISSRLPIAKMIGLTNRDTAIEAHNFFRNALLISFVAIGLSETFFHIKALKVISFVIEISLIIALTVMAFNFCSFLQKNLSMQNSLSIYLIKMFLLTQLIIALFFGNNNLTGFILNSAQTLTLLGIASAALYRTPAIVFDLMSKNLKGYAKKKAKKYSLVCVAMLYMFSIIGGFFLLDIIWENTLFALIWSFVIDKGIFVLLTLLLLSSIGLLLWEASEYCINYFLKQKKAEAKIDHSAMERFKRLETIMPLFSKIIKTVISLFIVLITIAELGFNITPLIAGAGVFGIALSLGSQSLVKDFINGCFILFENTISIGDSVDIGSHSGKVETLSLRSLTLRDTAGAIHNIPFSNINTIINYSKNYSSSLFLLNFDARTKYDDAKMFMKSAFEKLRIDPRCASLIMDDIEFDGLMMVDGNSYQAKATLKVTAGQQNFVERLFYEICADLNITSDVHLYKAAILQKVVS